MSDPLQFTEDQHISFPYVMLSKKKFLLVENNRLYYAKLQSGQSFYTPIAQLSEIRKLEAQMYHSKNASYLYISILPRQSIALKQV